MRKLFIDPTLEVKNFAVENIVTTSVQGTNDAAKVEELKTRANIERVTIDAGNVLQFN